jgi:hypothetical protein
MPYAGSWNTRRGETVRSGRRFLVGIGWLAVLLLVLDLGATGDVWGQGCASLTGYEDFGQYNQSPNDVAVAGSYAYTADLYGLTVYDVSDPANPAKVGELLLPEEASGVAVSGSVAYVADGESGLQIIDVTDPSAPSRLGSYDTPGYAWDVALFGNVAYVADEASGLQIIDVSDPTAPSLIGSVATRRPALDVAVEPATGTVWLADGALLEGVDAGCSRGACFLCGQVRSRRAGRERPGQPRPRGPLVCAGSGAGCGARTRQPRASRRRILGAFRDRRHRPLAAAMPGSIRYALGGR